MYIVYSSLFVSWARRGEREKDKEIFLILGQNKIYFEALVLGLMDIVQRS